MKSVHLPEPTRTYHSHTFDSTRWRHYKPRADDIIISTSYKSGTTWMQHIMLELLFPDQETPNRSISPWIDKRFGGPVEEMIANLEAQQHRRCIKTHLPLDVLPYYPRVKYIVVSRNPLDVFMSYWNHYSNYTDGFYDRLNDSSDLVGQPLPRCPEDIHDLWQIWITRGWFEGESEGYPLSGNMHHTQSWWDYHHLENILFIHFNDLLSDLAVEVGRIVAYLAIPASAETIEAVVEAVTFSTLKKNVLAEDEGKNSTFIGGTNTFYFKGTNGRWKDVLSAGELALCEAKITKILTPNCAARLEHGRLGER